VLIATTIIETGIDIPNVNTIIIENADLLGLGQLYQLKGRVGRSNRQAYAYYLLDNNKVVNEKAHARLNAIREFSNLGSGLEIAKKDLAIRGAGDILGRQQAGFISTIGIDLYNRLLQDEIAKIKGDYTQERVFEKPLININTTALDSYIFDTKLKIEIHQLINTICDEKSYINIKNQIIDRFGPLTDDLDNYLKSIWFEVVAREKGVIKIDVEYNNWLFYFEKTVNTPYKTKPFNLGAIVYLSQKEFNNVAKLLSFILKI
jgi:transcription-repair coupling factor (superfamily II helicase)